MANAKRTRKGNIKIVLSEQQADMLWMLMGKTHYAKFDDSEDAEQYRKAEPVSMAICSALPRAGLRYKGV